jgi:hypothetical protein
MADNRGNLRGSARSGSGDGVRGAEAFLALSRRLKEAGQTELRKELHKAVAATAKPLVPKVKKAGEAKAPTRGGMARHMGKKQYRAQTRTGEQTAGVRIVGTKVDPRIDATGRVAHPVFGRKGKAKNGGKNTVVQEIPGLAGYFSETLEQSGPEVRDVMVDVLNDFVRRMANEGRI